MPGNATVTFRITDQTSPDSEVELTASPKGAVSALVDGLLLEQTIATGTTTVSGPLDLQVVLPTVSEQVMWNIDVRAREPGTTAWTWIVAPKKLMLGPNDAGTTIPAEHIGYTQPLVPASNVLTTGLGDARYIRRDEIGGTSDVALQAHIDSPTPHPAYDIDMPSLRLIYENGLI